MTELACGEMTRRAGYLRDAGYTEAEFTAFVRVLRDTGLVAQETAVAMTAAFRHTPTAAERLDEEKSAWNELLETVDAGFKQSIKRTARPDKAPWDEAPDNPPKEGTEPPAPKQTGGPRTEATHITGFMRVVCGECDSVFVKTLYNGDDTAECKRCHTVYKLEDMAPYALHCTYCGRSLRGYTNDLAPSFELRCKCGVLLEARWSKKKKRYE